MKRSNIILRTVSLCLIAVFLTAALSACADGGFGLIKSVPVYEGMSIQGHSAHSASAGIVLEATEERGEPEKPTDASNPTEAEDTDPRSNVTEVTSDDWHDGAHGDFTYETDAVKGEDIKDVVTIEVSGDDTTKYYVRPGEEFIVEVHIANPDQFEIQSFTLNSEKYANYMFEKGSTMELLLLKVKAPSEPGYFELTIDAIKYIDGTEIKDVRMDGDKTIKAGVAYTDMPYAEFSDISITANSISLNVSVVDKQGALGENPVKFYLSDGEKIIHTAELKRGSNKISVGELYVGKAYQYGVASYYDAIDGKGVQPAWLGERTFETNKGFAITEAVVGQTQMEFRVEQAVDNGSITAIVIKDAKTGAVVESLTDLTKRGFDGLLSDHEYLIELKFSYKAAGATVEDSCIIRFTTRAKKAPDVNITEISADKTSVDFKVKAEDIDGILKLESLKLYLGGKEVKTADSFDVRRFEGLLSNNEYTLKLAYSYDLGDGTGVKTAVAEGSVKTQAKVAPTVTLESFMSSRNEIEFDIKTEDPDKILVIKGVSLKIGDKKLDAAITEHIKFSDLESGAKYTAVVSYAYDLGDGTGVHESEVKKDYPTLADSISIERIELLNMDGKVVKKGGQVSLRIYFKNSSEIEIKNIYVNGQKVTVDGGNRKTYAMVTFVPDDTGLVEFLVDRVDYEYVGETISQRVDSDVSVSYPIYNDLAVSFSAVSASPYQYTDGGIYLEFDNTDGYKVYKINDSTSFTKLSDNQFYVPDERITSIEYGYDNYGASSQTFDYHAGDRIYIGYDFEKGGRIYQSVSTPEEFYAMTNGYYILTKDIDLLGTKLTTMNFTGVLQGDGHTVRGLTNVVDASATEYKPIFTSGSIYDVNFTEIYINVTNYSDHWFRPFGNATLYNGSVQGDIIVSSDINKNDLFGVMPGSVDFELNITANGQKFTMNEKAERKVEKNEGVKLKDGFIYYVCPNGFTVICGYYGDDKAIEIPSSFDGNPVSLIGPYAFAGLAGLKTVEIPEGIVGIGEYAFANCRGLESIKLANSVDSIGRYVLQRCGKLASLDLGDGITNIGEGAFADCASLQRVYIKDITSWLNMGFSDWWATNPLEYAKELYFGDRLVTDLVIPEGIEHISARAFNGYRKLNSVTFPDSLISIGEWAFSGTQVNTVKFGKNLESIGDYAFQSCELRDFVIPASVKEIGEWVFEPYKLIYAQAAEKPAGWHANWRGELYEGCPDVVWNIDAIVTDSQGVKYMLYTDGTASVVSYGEYKGSNTSDVIIELPEKIDGHTVTHIAVNAFSRVNGNYKFIVVIPDTVTTVDEAAFNDSRVRVFFRGSGIPEGFSDGWIYPNAEITYNFKSIYKDELGFTFTVFNDGTARLDSYDGTQTEIVIPAFADGSKVTEIGYGVFMYREDITSVDIPDTVKIIGRNAFYNCMLLENIELPSELKIIRDSAFSFLQCSALKTLTVPNGVEIIETNAFSYIGSLETLTLGTGLREIGEQAFASCHKLTAIHIPSGVTSIGNSAFSGCYGVREVTLPDGLKRIGAGAFNGLDSLESIVIPASVEEIGDYGVVISWNGTIYAGPSEKPAKWHTNWYRHSGESDGRKVIWGFEKFLTDDNGIKYALFSDNTAKVLGCSGSATDIVILQTVEGHTVIEIGDNAFESNSTIISVKLPDSVVRLGDYAFNNCTKLVSINLPADMKYIGVCAFQNCQMLTAVSIPNGVEEIFTATFANCNKLESIKLGTGLKTIHDSAFSSCSVLNELVLPDGLISIGRDAFISCNGLEKVIIPASVETIGRYAFGYGDSSKLTIYAEAAEASSGWDGDWNRRDEFAVYQVIWNYSGFYTDANGIVYAFSGETEAIVHSYGGTAAQLIIPDTVDGRRVVGIADHAFYQCRDLLSVTLPNSITSIDAYAFYECRNMHTVNIPTELDTLGEYAFSYCRELTEITLPNTLTSIPNGAFDQCEKLATVKLGNAVESIGDAAFNACQKLADINFPSTIKSIGSSAFSSCHIIEEIVLPDGIETIGIYAFSNMGSLKLVILPASLTSVGEYAFRDGNSATKIYAAAASRPTGWDSSFNSSYNYDHYVAWNFREMLEDTASGIVYAIFNDATAKVAGYNGDASTLTVPAEYQGYPVVGIGYSAFEHCNNLTKIVLPDSITSIEQKAFANMEKLAEIIIPAGVEKIGARAFEYTYNVKIFARAASRPIGWHSEWNYKNDWENAAVIWNFKSIQRESNGATYALKNDNTATLYLYEGSASEFIIPESVSGHTVTGIAGRAFDTNRHSLTRIVIPSTVTEIADFAFANAYSLNHIYIPASVTSVGKYLFINIYNDPQIYVAAAKGAAGWADEWNRRNEGNTDRYDIIYNVTGFFTDADGMTYALCSDATAVLVSYTDTGKTELAIAQVIEGHTVTRIGNRAFYNIANIESVEIASSVTEIGSYAFAYCYNLRTVSLGTNIKKVGNYAFAGCPLDPVPTFGNDVELGSDVFGN